MQGRRVCLRELTAATPVDKEMRAQPSSSGHTISCSSIIDCRQPDSPPHLITLFQFNQPSRERTMQREMLNQIQKSEKGKDAGKERCQMKKKTTKTMRREGF
ncbi:hypothetical protein AMTR_s00109p00026200 [Amborella trichopoda]|uniref:Uncharacterized protein n=1 Tax=Amborella trichopoda TaxID=13333 RepID=W1NPF6_AMBTC|nr:hypothetical protein AMTR_s00109p00026200 [Amborella trichopoda]